MDKFPDYRSPKRRYDAQKSSSLKARVFKGRLYFLGRPRELLNSDVYRHTCRGCGSVFHKQQGLEWHVSDDHPHLLDQLTKDLARCKLSSPPGQKRVLPQRAAAPRGTKRWRMSLEETLVKEEQKDVESCSDIDGLLETSDEYSKHSDIDKLLETTGDDEDLQLQGLQEVLLSTKKCQVNLEKLDLSKLDMNNNKADSDSDIIIESVSQDSEDDIEVVFSGQPILSPEVVDISLSTHSVSSQPSTWSAPPEDPVSSTELPRFRHVMDKVTWWLSTHEAKPKP